MKKTCTYSRRKYFTIITIILISMLALFALSSCGNDAQSREDNPEPKDPQVVSETQEATDEGGSIAEDPSEASVPEAAANGPSNAESAPGKPETLKCTVTITCKTILDNMEELTPGKEEVIPADGLIMSSETVLFQQGDSVFDALVSATKARRIHMEFTTTPVYKSAYIEGIHNIYEFDCGELSGWMYKVNGEFPSRGCSTYQLSDGDAIEWIYSCSLGSDIGGNYMEQKGE